MNPHGGVQEPMVVSRFLLEREECVEFRERRERFRGWERVKVKNRGHRLKVWASYRFTEMLRFAAKGRVGSAFLPKIRARAYSGHPTRLWVWLVDCIRVDQLFVAFDLLILYYFVFYYLFSYASISIYSCIWLFISNLCLGTLQKGKLNKEK